MKTKRKILALLFLPFIIAGTTGISFKTNSCSIDGNKTSTVLPEVFGSEDDCCKPAETCRQHSNDVEQLHHSKIPCCKSVHNYSQLPVFSNHSVILPDVPTASIATINRMLNVHFVTMHFIKLFCITDQPPPPLLFGKFLLHFIQQIRIALP